MSDVAVSCQPGGDGWTCHVTVSEGGSRSEHEVRVGRDELMRLAPGSTEPKALVEASFAYLLEREPKEAVLRSFSIGEIERYFPGYGAEIRARL